MFYANRYNTTLSASSRAVLKAEGSRLVTGWVTNDGLCGIATVQEAQDSLCNIADSDLSDTSCVIHCECWSQTNIACLKIALAEIGEFVSLECRDNYYFYIALELKYQLKTVFLSKFHGDLVRSAREIEEAIASHCAGINVRFEAPHILPGNFAGKGNYHIFDTW